MSQSRVGTDDAMVVDEAQAGVASPDETRVVSVFSESLSVDAAQHAGGSNTTISHGQVLLISRIII